eukprot:Nk52_evm1s161 gene=Nk52_evmTU1s161
MDLKEATLGRLKLIVSNSCLYEEENIQILGEVNGWDYRDMEINHTRFIGCGYTNTNLVCAGDMDFRFTQKRELEPRTVSVYIYCHGMYLNTTRRFSLRLEMSQALPLHSFNGGVEILQRDVLDLGKISYDDGKSRTLRWTFAQHKELPKAFWSFHSFYSIFKWCPGAGGFIALFKSPYFIERIRLLKRKFSLKYEGDIDGPLHQNCTHLPTSLSSFVSLLPAISENTKGDEPDMGPVLYKVSGVIFSEHEYNDERQEWSVCKGKSLAKDIQFREFMITYQSSRTSFKGFAVKKQTSSCSIAGEMDTILDPKKALSWTENYLLDRKTLKPYSVVFKAFSIIKKRTNNTCSSMRLDGVDLENDIWVVVGLCFDTRTNTVRPFSATLWGLESAYVVHDGLCRLAKKMEQQNHTLLSRVRSESMPGAGPWLEMGLIKIDIEESESTDDGMKDNPFHGKYVFVVSYRNPEQEKQQLPHDVFVFGTVADIPCLNSQTSSEFLKVEPVCNGMVVGKIETEMVQNFGTDEPSERQTITLCYLPCVNESAPSAAGGNDRDTCISPHVYFLNARIVQNENPYMWAAFGSIVAAYEDPINEKVYSVPMSKGCRLVYVNIGIRTCYIPPFEKWKTSKENLWKSYWVVLEKAYVRNVNSLRAVVENGKGEADFVLLRSAPESTESFCMIGALFDDNVFRGMDAKTALVMCRGTFEGRKCRGITTRTLLVHCKKRDGGEIEEPGLISSRQFFIQFEDDGSIHWHDETQNLLWGDQEETILEECFHIFLKKSRLPCEVLDLYPAQKPVSVEIGFDNIVITDIDTPNMRFSCKFDSIVKWRVLYNDLVELMVGNKTLDSWKEEDLKSPELLLANQIQEARCPVTLPVELTVDTENARSFLCARVITTYSGVFNEPFELESYPFDCQDLPVILKCSSPAKKMILKPLKTLVLVQDGQDDTPEWVLERSVCEFSSGDSRPRSDMNLRECEVTHRKVILRFKMRRRGKSFLLRIFLTLFVIELATASVFFLDPIEHFADRMSYAVTMFLTAIAFQYIVSTWVPVLPYLTFLDKYLISCNLHIGLIILQVALLGYYGIENIKVPLVINMVAVFVEQLLFGFCYWFHIVCVEEEKIHHLFKQVEPVRMPLLHPDSGKIELNYGYFDKRHSQVNELRPEQSMESEREKNGMCAVTGEIGQGRTGQIDELENAYRGPCRDDIAYVSPLPSCTYPFWKQQFFHEEYVMNSDTFRLIELLNVSDSSATFTKLYYTKLVDEIKNVFGRAYHLAQEIHRSFQYKPLPRKSILLNERFSRMLTKRRKEKLKKMYFNIAMFSLAIARNASMNNGESSYVRMEVSNGQERGEASENGPRVVLIGEADTEIILRYDVFNLHCMMHTIFAVLNCSAARFNCHKKEQVCSLFDDIRKNLNYVIRTSIANFNIENDFKMADRICKVADECSDRIRVLNEMREVPCTPTFWDSHGPPTKGCKLDKCAILELCSLPEHCRNDMGQDGYFGVHGLERMVCTLSNIDTPFTAHDPVRSIRELIKEAIKYFMERTMDRHGRTWERTLKEFSNYLVWNVSYWILFIYYASKTSRGTPYSHLDVLLNFAESLNSFTDFIDTSRILRALNEYLGHLNLQDFDTRTVLRAYLSRNSAEYCSTANCCKMGHVWAAEDVSYLLEYCVNNTATIISGNSSLCRTLKFTCNKMRSCSAFFQRMKEVMLEIIDGAIPQGEQDNQRSMHSICCCIVLLWYGLIDSEISAHMEKIGGFFDAKYLSDISDFFKDYFTFVQAVIVDPCEDSPSCFEFVETVIVDHSADRRSYFDIPTSIRKGGISGLLFDLNTRNHILYNFKRHEKETNSWKLLKKTAGKQFGEAIADIAHCDRFEEDIKDTLSISEIEINAPIIVEQIIDDGGL